MLKYLTRDKRFCVCYWLFSTVPCLYLLWHFLVVVGLPVWLSLRLWTIHLSLCWWPFAVVNKFQLLFRSAVALLSSVPRAWSFQKPRLWSSHGKRQKCRSLHWPTLRAFKVSAQLECMFCLLISSLVRLGMWPYLPLGQGASSVYLEVLAVMWQRAWMNKPLAGKGTGSWGSSRSVLPSEWSWMNNSFIQEKTEAWRYYVHAQLQNSVTWASFADSVCMLFPHLVSNVISFCSEMYTLFLGHTEFYVI